MSVTECEIDFKQFCEKDAGGRYALDNPFVKGGWMVATDCRVMLVIRSEAPDSEPVPNKRRPDPVPVIEKAQSIASAFEWPDSFPECAECGQSGIIPAQLVGAAKECRTCNGKGEQQCDLGHDHDCSDCDGSGYESRRTPDQFEPQPCGDCTLTLGTQKFHRQYIHKINQLPGPIKYGIKDDMMVCRGSGWTVILMALRKD